MSALPPPPGAGPDGGLPPPPLPIVAPTAPTLATLWQRLGARLLDGLIVGTPLIVVLFSTLQDVDPQFGLSASQEDRITRAVLITSAIGAVYEIVLVALRGQTLGKMIVGIRVVRMDTGGSVGWGRSTLRWFVPAATARLPGVLSTLQLLIYLWMVWDPNRQGLHDKAAGTVVVRLR